MYRRNITHILVPLGIALLLLVVYHVSVKSLTVTPAVSGSDTIPTVESVAEPPTPPPSTPKEEMNQVRTIEHTAVPSVPQSSLLEAIRDDIETGNLARAESQLKTLPQSLVSNADTKAFVAVLWNNLGLQQEGLDGTGISVNAFKKAAALDERNPVIQLNLAHAYWAQRDRALNVEFLTKLVSLAPNEPFPHLAMADLLYEQDHLNEAAAHLTHATERIKNDPGLRSYFDAVTTKIRRADSAEARMTARSSTHFVVKFDGADDPGTWTTVLGILEEAYRDIGQRFGHFPAKPIVVVLHTRETFPGATGSPAWADGLYDSVLGRIQIPTQGATTDTAWLTHVLRHEYVHALLHDSVGLSGGFVPTWLNEGLAMQLDGKDWPDLEQAMRGEVQVIPLQYLEGGWGGMPHNVAILAYLEAHSATRFLIDRWGMAGVDGVLTALKAKESVANALQSKLSVSYDQFHSRWLDTFRQKRT